ncbi:MAG: D-alanyl-D-alanine carboxypeptidase/D-alanyl-D-alanine-endopeptidase [Vicinamibacteria bacterium]|nr:D-alanyl-D-alanine carboxypeptidase/D-alanyl-D-alanine-endopeptidase [Vicinamibacteria bacterium]
MASLLLTSVAALAGERSTGPLKARIDPIVERAALAAASWGVEVRSLKTGAVLYACNERKSLAPASTLKLITTATAADLFAPSDVFPTTVETAGRLDAQGRLVGDVYLIGRGDPTVVGSSPDAPITIYDRIVESLKASGLRRIEGRLLGYEGTFVGERRGDDWVWGDLVWYYGAEASALCFNNGAAHIRVAPGERVGDPVFVERNPVSGYYRVISRATTSEARVKGDLRLVRNLGGSTIELSGTLPAGSAPENLFVALEDPARYATTVFAETLVRQGIAISGSVDTTAAALPADLRPLATWSGPSLAQILREVNLPSHNLRAEMLLRSLGLRGQQEGSAAAGLAAERAFLARLSVDTTGFQLCDGSGLSRSNLVTAHGMVDLLAAMERHPRAQVFKDSLPLIGVSGTLRNRMKGTFVEGRVRAKSGSIRNNTALAGYATTLAGEPLAFAILINHHTADEGTAYAAIDAFCAAVVRAAR